MLVMVTFHPHHRSYIHIDTGHTMSKDTDLRLAPMTDNQLLLPLLPLLPRSLLHKRHKVLLLHLYLPRSNRILVKLCQDLVELM